MFYISKASKVTKIWSTVKHEYVMAICTNETQVIYRSYIINIINMNTIRMLEGESDT